MRTFSQLKDLPVITLDEGHEVGKIYDLCLNNLGQVEGLAIDVKGWFHKNKFLPISSVYSIGDDCVLIADKSMLSDEETYQSHFLQHGNQSVAGKIVMSTEGEKLGLMEDVYFSENMGNIVGYEVSEGFFVDITEGRKVLKTEKPLTIGDSVIVMDLE